MSTHLTATNPAILGYAMAAYFGGRAECRIRRTPVPVVLVDFLSMYPTVNALMELWDLHRAANIRVVDETDGVRSLVGSITLERCFDPRLWREFAALVQIHPDDDILPLRAAYGLGRDRQIGVNIVRYDGSLWYALPDVVASTILTGKPPRILRAIRFVPDGTLRDGLTPTRLRGTVPIDPRRRDFFRAVIEERTRLKHDDAIPKAERERIRLALKIIANSGAYGIFAEMVRKELPGDELAAVTVHGLDEPFVAKVHAPESPGAYCYPPVAAMITAAARLMLALLERCVTDLGGAYAFCDTDSMAIVASEQGGLVPCIGGNLRTDDGREAIYVLTWDEVDAIVARFAALNPYNREIVPGSVLEVEDENRDSATKRQRQLYAYSISAKRYALYTLDEGGEPTIVKYSEHGLGYLLNPTDPDREDRDWIRELWMGIVREALGLPHVWPDWLDRPALSRITASSPAVMAPFVALKDGKGYADRIKPFNFLLAAHVRGLGYPGGVDPEHFQLIAPYESDPRDWRDLPWINRHSKAGKCYRITTRGVYGGPGVARVMTYRDVLDRYRAHEEGKSARPNGRPCQHDTVGLLQRRHVHVVDIRSIGKANELEAVQAGQVHDLDAVVTEYRDPRRDPWHRFILPVSRDMTKGALHRATGISERQIQRYWNDPDTKPWGKQRKAFSVAIIAFARDQLKVRDIVPPIDDLAACGAYLIVKESCR
jgi:hypothetical protein